ncbi:hypothetical protein BY996DRAFT_7060706 [Phakopsora pachyrhizi]|nr:hypothetical protein BY996DRAFT_7060706 [Phakopsora pachyrhizi]
MLTYLFGHVLSSLSCCIVLCFVFSVFSGALILSCPVSCFLCLASPIMFASFVCVCPVVAALSLDWLQSLVFLFFFFFYM